MVQVSSNRRPAPPPLEANDQLVTAVITAGWAIALVTLLALRTELAPGSRWWIWTCLFGTCVGLFGLYYIPRLKRSRARLAKRRAEARSAGTGSSGAGSAGAGSSGAGSSAADSGEAGDSTADGAGAGGAQETTGPGR